LDPFSELKAEDMMWFTLPNGERKRIYCKTCLREGKTWLTSNPCRHILEAEDGITVKNIEASQKLEQELGSPENAESEHA
jgi:hypothetical protein